MALFGSREEHLANPPESWEVVKVAERLWHLRPAGASYYFGSYPTRKAASADQSSGFYVNLWHRIADELTPTTPVVGVRECLCSESDKSLDTRDCPIHG